MTMPNPVFAVLALSGIGDVASLREELHEAVTWYERALVPASETGAALLLLLVTQSLARPGPQARGDRRDDQVAVARRERRGVVYRGRSVRRPPAAPLRSAGPSSSPRTDQDAVVGGFLRSAFFSSQSRTSIQRLCTKTAFAAAISTSSCMYLGGRMNRLNASGSVYLQL